MNTINVKIENGNFVKDGMFLHYDVLKHVIVEGNESYPDDPCAASLYSVMENILDNRYTDYKASRMFGEPDEYNTYTIGSYDDMPGEEIKAIVYVSIDGELWEKFINYKLDNAESTAEMLDLRDRFNGLLNAVKNAI